MPDDQMIEIQTKLVRLGPEFDRSAHDRPEGPDDAVTSLYAEIVAVCKHVSDAVTIEVYVGGLGGVDVDEFFLFSITGPLSQFAK